MAAITTGNIVASGNYDEGPTTRIIPLSTSGRFIYATTAALAPGPAVYSTTAWPHTLTGASNLALTVDGVAVAVNDLIIAKDQATGAHNGVYIVTAIGSGAAVWTMARVASWIPPVKEGTTAIATAGSTNINKAYTLSADVNVVGTDSVTLALNSNVAKFAKYCTYDVLPTTVVATSTTLTSGINQALVVDEIAVALNDVILVRAQANPADNGLYTVTTVGSGAAKWVLTRTTAPQTVFSAFPVSATSASAGGCFNTCWYLTAAVSVVGTDPWNFAPCNGNLPVMAVAATTNTMTLHNDAVLTITSDTLWGATGQSLCTIASGVDARNVGVTIDASQTWWAPYTGVGGTGTVPILASLGTGATGVVDVTRSAVGIGRFLGIWANLGRAPVLAGAALPTSGFIKFRQLESGVTLAAGDVLTLSNTTTITLTSGGQYGWLYVTGPDLGTITLNEFGSFTTTGQWFYLDDATGYPGQHVQCPIAGQYPAVQVETAAGSGVYEWWLNAGVFSGPATTTSLKWGGTCCVQSNIRAKYFGCSFDGCLEFGPRGYDQQSFPDCKLVSTTAPAGAYTATNQIWLETGTTGALTIDGVATAINDIILIAGTAAASNGIFIRIANAAGPKWQLQRLTGFNADQRYIEALRPCFITAGTAGAGLYYVPSFTYAVDTATALTFVTQPIFGEFPPCELATTSATSLSSGAFAYDSVTEILTCTSGFAALAVDSVNAVVGNRILVKDQATASQNGIYKVLSVGTGSVSWQLQREWEFSKRYNTSGYDLPIRKNSWTRILSGTTNSRKCFILDTDVATVGTSSVTWVAGDYGWNFPSCKAATFALTLNAPTYSNPTLTATNTEEPYQRLVIDGVTLSNGDRVCIAGQTNGLQNGIYTVTTQGDASTAWVLTRANDFSSAVQPIYYNQRVYITDGYQFRGVTLTLQRTVTTVNTDTVEWGLGEPNTEWTKCLLATTGALAANTATATTLTKNSPFAALVIDGHAMAVNDVVLVKDEAATANNGIYTVTAIGSGAAAWVLTRQARWTGTGAAPYGCVGQYTGGFISTYSSGTSTNFNMYYYLNAPVITFGTTACTFVRGCAASQMKSCRYTNGALGITITASTNDTFSSSTAIDNVAPTSLFAGDRVLARNVVTTTTQQGIYEVTSNGASTATYQRVRGMDNAACTTTGGGTGNIPFGLWVQMTPFLYLGTAAPMSPHYARILQNQLTAIGTAGTVATFVNASGPQGYIPPAGAHIRIPNIYCGSVLATAPATLNYTIGPYIQPSYNATTTSRYRLISNRATISISNTVLLWAITVNATGDFSITNSAVAEGIRLAEESKNPVTFNTVGISGIINASAAIMATLASSPIYITRVTGAILTDVAASKFSTAAVGLTALQSSGMTLSNCRFVSFGGTLGQDCERSAASNRNALFTACHNISMTNIVTIGCPFECSSCNNVYINGYEYDDRLAGYTNATNAVSAIYITNCNSALIKGFNIYSRIPDGGPYTAILSATKSNDLALIDWGTPYAPVRFNSRHTTTATNPAISNPISFTSTEVMDSLIARRIYTKGGRTANAFMSTTTLISVRNCEYTNIWHHVVASATNSLAMAGDNFIARGCFGTSIDTVQTNGSRDSIFVDYCTTSTAGVMAILCSQPVEFASYVTLGGNASFNANGQLVMLDVGDSCIWEWPFFVLGYTSFNSGTAVAFTPTATNIGFTFQYNTAGTWNGSWIALTASNLNTNVGAINPATGIKLKIKAVTATGGALLTPNTLQKIVITMVTDAVSRATQYTTAGIVQYQTGSDSYVRGRPTGFIYNVGRSITQVQTDVVSTSDASATASYEWQQSLDPITGRETAARIKYSATQLPLYLRVGDDYNL